MISIDSKSLNTQFMAEYFTFDEGKEMYLLHKGQSRYPSFYYLPDDLAIYVEKGDCFFLLTFGVSKYGELRQFFNLMQIDFEL